MFVNDPQFPTFPDDTNIWRYMNFYKFVSCLNKGSLYFPRFDKLGDPLEGDIGFKGRELLREQIDQLKDTKFVSGFEKSINLSKYLVFINSWHMGPTESSLMWKSYCPSGEGIAIKSTYLNLKESLNEDEIQQFYVMPVKYVDHKEAIIGFGNIFQPFKHKALFYQSENELRVIAFGLFRNDKSRLFPVLEPELDINDPKYFGYFFKVDLKKLITAVYLSPLAPGGLFEVTRECLDSANLNDVPILYSDLK